VNNHQNGPPDGGDGGRGGNVILRLDSSLNTLAGLSRYAYRPNSFGGGGGAAIQKRKIGSGGGGNGGGGGGGADAGRMLSFRAENGADGGRQNKRGGVGKDIVVRVPPGTIVQEERTNDDGDHGSGENEQCHFVDIGTITYSNPTIIGASGGAGGEGSAVTSERHQRGTRRVRAPPRPGERMRLKLTLQVVADVALVAVPNAGKSTLLSKVTRAKPKIADYPFTTVVPNLGVWVPSSNIYDDDCIDDYDESIDENGNPIPSNRKGGNSLILCDVPGLIAGASEGIGLGHAFLRHVERCHVILHLLDATSSNVIEEYAMINRELLNYGTGKLAAMPQVVVVNKVDVAFASSASTSVDDDVTSNRCFRTKEELEAKLLEVMPHSRLMWISAKEEEGVDDLMERVAMFVKKVKSVSVA
jgi:GTP-binding protein